MSALPQLRHVALLRVLAIAGVVSLHASTGPIAAHAEPSATRTTAALLNGAGRWAVPAFVLVSGMLLLTPKAKDVPVGEWYRHRLARLLPAIVFWHAVFVLLRVGRGQDTHPRLLLRLVVEGRLYTGLYFFSIVLGLALVAPALIRLMPRDGARVWLAVGGALCLLTWAWEAWRSLRGDRSAASTYGPFRVWSFWVPYLGYFALGGALRRLSVTRVVGLAALVVALPLVGLTVLQTERLERIPYLDRLSPVTYFSLVIGLSAVALVVAAQGLGQVERLRPLVTSTAVRRLGDVTLGVFGLHLLVLFFVRRQTPGLEGSPVGMVLLFGFVLAVSYALVLAAARVPYLRRVV